MKINIKMGMAAVILLVGMGVTSIYARSEATVENHFSTGIVDVSLEEYSVDEDGQEIPWRDIKNVLPGDCISKIPRIINQGNDCYVRAKIEFSPEALDMNDVYGMSDTWFMAKDGYYYFKDVLKTGEYTELFQGIRIPENFKQSFETETFQVNIFVEAIQSEHFTQDIDALMPWGSVEILQCEKNGNHSIALLKMAEATTFQLQYQGDAQQCVVNASDFFSNFPEMLPGDVYKDSAELVNQSSQRIHLYFRTSKVDTSNEILEKIQLKITKCIGEDTEIVYEGALNAESLNQGICLCSLDAGMQGILNYELSVPETLDNAYSLMNEKVIWIFSTEPIEEPIEETAVPTGDTGLLPMKIVLCLTAAGVMCLMIWRYKRGVM